MCRPVAWAAVATILGFIPASRAQNGACCLPGGVCQDRIDPFLCDLVGGNFLGVGRSCYETTGMFLTFTSPLTATITPGQGVTLPFFLPFGFVVGDIEVLVDITHANHGDLSIHLTSPNGTTATLYDRNCNAEPYFNIDATFSDHGADLCASPLSGLVLPIDSLRDAFEGQIVFGDWTLTVVDHVGLSVGQLHSFSLRMDPRGSADAARDCCECTLNQPGDVDNLLAFLAQWFAQGSAIEDLLEYLDCYFRPPASPC